MGTNDTSNKKAGPVRLSVVIPTYERPDRALGVCDALERQSLAPDLFEAVIVDDGSKVDPSPKLLEKERPYRLIVHRQPNRGAAAARHRGAELSAGEVLLFVDDDMLLSPELLAEHLRVHESTPRAVVIGCIRSSKKLSDLSLFERFHAKKLEDFWADLRKTGRFPRGSELCSGNLSLRREDYFAVGGFDTSLGRAEDMEIGIRLEKAGAQIRFSDAAYTVHDSDRTHTAGWLRGAFTYGVSEQRISKKHPESFEASPYRYLDVVSRVPMPAYALSILAPNVGEKVVTGLMALAEKLDARGLERAALAGTMLAYGMQYYRGVRAEAGSAAACGRDLLSARRRSPARRRPRKGHTRRSERREALSRFVAAVRADHDMLLRSDAKYDTRGRQAASLAHDMVERIGFQMLVAYRVMKLLHEAGPPLSAKVAARLIRLVYGADIHWNSQIEPGVAINHGMGLAIGHSAKIGKGVILSHNVGIGDGIDPKTRKTGQPTLKDGVHVGPGALILGPITIGARTKIMPNAVVLESVPPDSVVETAPVRIRPRKQPPTADPPQTEAPGA